MSRDLSRATAGALGALAAAALICCADATTAEEPQVQRSTWNGFERLDFEVDGRKCLLVLPHRAAAGNPWIWRTEFFGHEPQADLALLARGFHAAYMDVQNMYGAPVAVRHMDALYAYLTSKRGLARQVVLEGFSRGGLFAFNWAAKNPDKVSCIYADAPVCDFRSWPGGKGRGKGSSGDWDLLKKVYGLSEDEALGYRFNPVDSLRPLAEAKIPLLHVCGEADTVVPIEENTRVIEKRYRELGGTITVLAKPFCEHHPHSLKEPAPIVEFILRHTAGIEAPKPRPQTTPYGYDYYVLRAGLGNCRIRFLREGQGRVAFLGGSITEGGAWREMVAKELQRRFPQARFDFINAGIASLGSTPGAFRFARDVLARGRVDLLFAEAAVNDETNGQTPLESLRGMEGIVRQARLANPAIDVVLLHFVDPDKMAVIRQGRTPAVIESHEKVAAHYGVASIDLAQEVAERIHAGEFTWEKDFRDLHPSPFGQSLYFRSVQRLLDAAWPGPPAADAQVQPYPLSEPLDAKSYFRGRLLGAGAAQIESGWKLDPRWMPRDHAGTRPGFVQVPALVAEQPGAALYLDFEGTAVGIFVAAGPDAGTVEFRVDDSPTATRNLFTPWSAGLHLPWAQVLAADLPPGKHRLHLRVAPAAAPKSKGHAVRIIHFLTN